MKNIARDELLSFNGISSILSNSDVDLCKGVIGVVKMYSHLNNDNGNGNGNGNDYANVNFDRVM